MPATLQSTSDVLQSQIDERRQEIHSDQYAMSIGEITNLYRDGDLDIHPEFQRFFRWTDEQKSRFVESVLLGIPIPSIFVAQRSDGKWDLIDGQQRLSTLFQLIGLLKDENGKQLPNLMLTRTKYLPALEGKVWSGQGDRLTPTQQLLIKRAKLDVKIILRESQEDAKFELFQRLNTGGSELTDQEIRNAMLVATNPEHHRWLKGLAESNDFVTCVPLSERQLEERYNMELVLRFLLLRELPEAEFKEIGDIGFFLTDRMVEFFADFQNLRMESEQIFADTFKKLASATGENAFRKYEESGSRYKGAFLISGFEAVALGIAYHIKRGTLIADQNIESKIKELWSTAKFTSKSGSGIRASSRIPETISTGRRLFKK